MGPSQLLIFASTSAILEGSGTTLATEAWAPHEHRLDRYAASMLRRERKMSELAAGGGGDGGGGDDGGGGGDGGGVPPRLVALRFGTVIGVSPGQRVDLGPMALMRSAFTSGELRVAHAETSRAFLDLDDLCRAMHALVTKPRPTPSQLRLASPSANEPSSQQQQQQQQMTMAEEPRRHHEDRRSSKLPSGMARTPWPPLDEDAYERIVAWRNAGRSAAEFAKATREEVTQVVGAAAQVRSLQQQQANGGGSVAPSPPPVGRIVARKMKRRRRLAQQKAAATPSNEPSASDSPPTTTTEAAAAPATTNVGLEIYHLASFNTNVAGLAAAIAARTGARILAVDVRLASQPNSLDYRRWTRASNLLSLSLSQAVAARMPLSLAHTLIPTHACSCPA